MKRVETMVYIGANRRSKKTGIEHLLKLEAGEAAAISIRQKTFHGQLADSFETAGMTSVNSDHLQADPGSSAACAFAHWFAASVIALQRAAKHEVSQFHVIPSDKHDHCRAWYEFEHSDVARRAARLALWHITRLIPEPETGSSSC